MYITVIFSILLSQLVKIQKFVLGLIWLLVCCFSLELKNLLGLSSWNFLNFCGTRYSWVSPLHFDNQTFHFLVRTWISSQTGIFWQGFNRTRYTTSPGGEPQPSHHTSLFSCSSTSSIYTGHSFCSSHEVPHSTGGEVFTQRFGFHCSLRWYGPTQQVVDYSLHHFQCFFATFVTTDSIWFTCMAESNHKLTNLFDWFRFDHNNGRKRVAVVEGSTQK